MDRALIRILQQDARTPFTRIAEYLGQPDTTIHFRTRKLRENGIVTRFCALVQPESLGYCAATLLRVEIGGHILPQISMEQYLWIAVDREPMSIYALLMGADDEDIEHRVNALRRSPDVTRVTTTPLAMVVKGWEISGRPQD